MLLLFAGFPFYNNNSMYVIRHNYKLIQIAGSDFRVGDKVKIGKDVGTIHDIGLRSTKLRTYDNELMTIPNGSLANSTIVNYVMPDDAHRAKVVFSAGYGCDPEKVKKIILKTISTPQIDEVTYDDEDKEPNVVFTGMGDSGLNFAAMLWSTWTNSYSVKLEMNKRIYEALNKANIEIPFPTRTLYMHNVKNISYQDQVKIML